MRKILIISGIVAGAAAASSASAATVVIYQDPMTMERRTVVLDNDGPDRAYWCMLPPSNVGCREVPVKRARR